LTVRTRALLVPPLEQPRLPVLPADVCTVTLKLPGAGIMDEPMVAVSCELLFTAVARVAPSRTITEAETNWPPVAVSTKLGGNSGSLQLRVLRLGFLQDGDIRVGAFPESRKRLLRQAHAFEQVDVARVGTERIHFLEHTRGQAAGSQCIAGSLRARAPTNGCQWASGTSFCDTFRRTKSCPNSGMWHNRKSTTTLWVFQGGIDFLPVIR